MLRKENKIMLVFVLRDGRTICSDEFEFNKIMLEGKNVERGEWDE